MIRDIITREDLGILLITIRDRFLTKVNSRKNKDQRDLDQSREKSQDHDLIVINQ